MKKSGKKIREVLLICAVFTLMNLTGDPAWETITGPDRAFRVFHDIFYLYYDDPAAARALLRSLTRVDRVKGGAYVNLGYLDEREGRSVEAEDHYRLAIRRGEPRAYAYLLHVLAWRDSTHENEFLKMVPPSDRNAWYWYSRSLVSLRAGNGPEALSCFEKAVSEGLRGRALIEQEPLFNPLRKSSAFQRMLRSLEKDEGAGPLAGALSRRSDAVSRESPRGLSPELARVAELMGQGRYNRARSLLTRGLEEPGGFRDAGIALYWLARLEARRGDGDGARAYLALFYRHLRSARYDQTGFGELMNRYHGEIIANDRYLRPYAPVQ